MRFPSLISIAYSLLLSGLTLARPSSAQQSSNLADLPLEGILLRLQIQRWAYTASVPSFFCDEHVVSNLYRLQITSGRTIADSIGTTTDSIFRLKRSDSHVAPVQLTEAREIKSVNNKPTQGEAISGPAIFVGAFSNALTLVSLDLIHCYDYHVTPRQHLRRAPALVIEYSLKPSLVSDSSCPGPEIQIGRAYIDPQTFQILRIEMRTPNHEINSGIYGPWIWSIDYGPVAFDGKTFWMPKIITSKATSKSLKTEWSFVATYRNYHKLTVTSRILPSPIDNPIQ
ncbi:MAG: hypothetical protein JWQ42_3715 [Edaphobacter sp.]|nr:hypothetical protein [Edaphobacter sp.]